MISMANRGDINPGASTYTRMYLELENLIANVRRRVAKIGRGFGDIRLVGEWQYEGTMKLAAGGLAISSLLCYPMDETLNGATPKVDGDAGVNKGSKEESAGFKGLVRENELMEKVAFVKDEEADWM